MPQQVGATGIKGLEFVEIATADVSILDKVLQQLHFRKIAVHRSKAVQLYRQGALNIIVNCEKQARLGIKDQSAGSQIRAMAVRVDNAKKSYEALLQKGAWGRESSGEAMELNIPSIEIAGGCALYLVENSYTHFSIYDVDFKPLEPQIKVENVLSQIASLSLNVTAAHCSKWRDFFVQLLDFTVVGDDLLSPDQSFLIKFNRPVGLDIADEGIAGIGFLAAENVADTWRYAQGLPESIGFNVEITPPVSDV